MHPTSMQLSTWIQLLGQNKSISKNTYMHKGKGHMTTHKLYQFEYQNEAQIDLQEEKLMKAGNKELSIEPSPEVFALYSLKCLGLIHSILL